MDDQDSFYAPRPNGVTIALLYTCASIDDQTLEGRGLPSQLGETRRYAAQAGWAIGGEYQDILSGKQDDRPGYQALLSDARRLLSEGQGAAVVVSGLDRFGESVLEQAKAIEELSRLGVPVHSVMEGGLMPEPIANVLAAVGQEEARRHAERVSGARRHLAAAGWYLPGVAPWGYRWREATPEERAAGAPKGVIEEDPITAPYVREAYRRAAGGEAIHSIARWIQSLPEAARGGRRMTYQAVRFILRCPTYISRAWPSPNDSKRGKLSEPLSTEQGRWPALVDEATWHRAQELVERHQQIPRQASGRHLLTGFLRCPRCGSRMIGVDLPQGKRLAVREASYQCRGVHNLGAAAPDPACRFRAAKQPVDAALLDRLCAVVDVVTTGDARLQSALRAAWRQLRDEVPASTIAAQIAQLEREAERYRFRLTEGARLLVDGVLDRRGYERLRDAQEANLRSTEAEVARLRGIQPKESLPPLDEVTASAASWAEILRSGGVPAQREVLALLVRRVVPIEQVGGQYDVEITWTPLGSSLARLAGSR